jgi:uncharacterized protein YndB with AHSA1/START domain
MRYLLIAAAALAAILVIVLIIGWSLPVEHHATREATFKSSPQSLYQLITDVDRYTEWRSSVKRIENLPDSAGKKRFRETGSDGSIVYEIDSAIRDRRLVTRIADLYLKF